MAAHRPPRLPVMQLVPAPFAVQGSARHCLNLRVPWHSHLFVCVHMPNRHLDHWLGVVKHRLPIHMPIRLRSAHKGESEMSSGQN
jgi:hypothetical protein